jgi:hypothetical protein
MEKAFYGLAQDIAHKLIVSGADAEVFVPRDESILGSELTEAIQTASRVLSEAILRMGPRDARAALLAASANISREIMAKKAEKLSQKAELQANRAEKARQQALKAAAVSERVQQRLKSAASLSHRIRTQPKPEIVNDAPEDIYKEEDVSDDVSDDDISIEE